jgi:hypothetical protein
VAQGHEKNCPPSTWNGVLHQNGVTVRDRWNTQWGRFRCDCPGVCNATYLCALTLVAAWFWPLAPASYCQRPRNRRGPMAKTMRVGCWLDRQWEPCQGRKRGWGHSSICIRLDSMIRVNIQCDVSLPEWRYLVNKVEEDRRGAASHFQEDLMSNFWSNVNPRSLPGAPDVTFLQCRHCIVWY